MWNCESVFHWFHCPFHLVSCLNFRTCIKYPIISDTGCLLSSFRYPRLKWGKDGSPHWFEHVISWGRCHLRHSEMEIWTPFLGRGSGSPEITIEVANELLLWFRKEEHLSILFADESYISNQSLRDFVITPYPILPGNLPLNYNTGLT